MLGLVLEGGGTKGSYQIGVYEALLDEGIEINGITGTSIGSINGAMIAQGDYLLAKDLWENINYSMIVDLEEDEIDRLENFKFDKESISFLGSKIKKFIRDGGLDITPLKKLLNEKIDEEKIRTSGKDFGIVTVNVSDMKPLEMFIEDIPKGELKKFLLASSYLPSFKSERIDGSFYLDGAFYDNLPFNMLKSKGYNKFILVRIFGTGIVRKIDMDEDEYILISPRENLGSSYECNPEKSKYNMKLGYYDALRALRKLRGNRYYIESEEVDSIFFERLVNLESKKIEEISEILNIPLRENKIRLLFEDIVPKLMSFFSLDKNATYEDLYIELLENKAEKIGLERFNIYNINDFHEKVINTTCEDDKEDNDIGVINKLKEKVETFSLFNKKDASIKVLDVIFSKI